MKKTIQVTSSGNGSENCKKKFKISSTEKSPVPFFSRNSEILTLKIQEQPFDLQHKGEGHRDHQIQEIF